MTKTIEKRSCRPVKIEILRIFNSSQERVHIRVMAINKILAPKLVFNDLQLRWVKDYVTPDTDIAVMERTIFHYANMHEMHSRVVIICH
jgi:hypothetical protein